MSKKDPKLFDVRALERNLRNRQITVPDIQSYLDSLPDVSHKGITLGEIEDERAAEAAAAPAETETSSGVVNPVAPSDTPSY